eukprot:3978858-Prymnesium_polylepis.1
MNFSGGTWIKDSGTAVKANRWSELVQTVDCAADISQLLGASTDFHFLNGSAECRKGKKQFITIAASEASRGLVAPRGSIGTRPDLHAAMEGLPCYPAGTPLTARTKDVIESIRTAEAALRSANQEAVVVV